MSKVIDENKNRTTSIGPSLGYTDNFPKRQMWKEIAKEQKGEFKVKFNSGHEVEIHNISIPHKKWNIEISVSDTRPLKFTVYFSSLQEFNLMISWEDFIERVFKIFSKPEIKLGNKVFDKRYLIKSKQPGFVKSIFSGAIQKAMLKHNVYSISYTTNSKTNKAELISVIQREAGNKKMMVDLIVMFKDLIDKLEKLKIVK